ncbi:unnamed protein product [Rhizoctonia solani]|uniref:glucan 1,4-alpha-glucosidase n=1 Tax=Rhizoctonia solani TaxID=456999 RepID=A0A8H2XQT6_9AGAM|nr:unnamed protein product [Rhizoctonia solani]
MKTPSWSCDRLFKPTAPFCSFYPHPQPAMDGKFLPPTSPFTTYPATRRAYYAKTLAAGALVGAAMVLTFKHSSLAGAPRGQPTNTWGSSELRDWIAHEATFSERKIFEHLGPTVGAGEGLVVASPSTSHPDYFYTWTRDSALVTASIMDRLAAGENELEATLRLYSYSQAKLQNTCNKSGCPADGGLGEPKFNVDGTPFDGSWGRPQRDGPALRAITLIRFANYLLDRGTSPDRDFVSRFLYNQDTSSGRFIIKNDLEYTSHMCFDTSYDLWEEKQDLHFFTLVACRKALSSGATLAHRLGDSGAAAWYKQQFNVMTSRILNSNMFFFPDGSYRAYANPQKLERRGVDSAVLLAILAAGEAGDPNFGPTAPAVLASVKVYVDAFRGMYTIANSSEQSFGVAPVPTGRYPEDKWDGYETGSGTLGNPWYLCTVAVPHASLIDWALVEFALAGNITVTDVSLPFFQQFASVKSGDVLVKGSADFNSMVSGMRAWSDGFYKIIQHFQGPSGVLYEQFNRRASAFSSRLWEILIVLRSEGILASHRVHQTSRGRLLHLPMLLVPVISWRHPCPDFAWNRDLRLSILLKHDSR